MGLHLDEKNMYVKYVSLPQLYLMHLTTPSPSPGCLQQTSERPFTRTITNLEHEKFIVTVDQLNRMLVRIGSSISKLGKPFNRGHIGNGDQLYYMCTL